MAFARTAINTTGNFTNGSTSITGVASTANMFVGMNLYGTRIQADTQITAISGTTVTMSKTATGTQTGGDITSAFIIQSGTDANPSGLSAMTGVTTITRGSGSSLRTTFDLGTNILRFQGTITIDPDLFEIVASVRSGLSFEAGSNVTYGVARTVNGQTSYSKGTGLVSTFNGDYFTAFGITWSGGTFTWNGGVIKTFGAVSQGGANTFISNSYDSVWQCWGTDGQFRSGGTPTFNAITVQGVNATGVLFMNGGWNALSVKYERCFYQTPAGGNSLRTIINPQFIGNQSTSDLNANSGVASVVAVRNPDRFPNVIKMGTAIYADFPIQETTSLTITNSVGAAAQNVVAYIKDSNNGSRINTIGNTYVTDRTYIATSNASGVASLGEVLTAVFSNLNLTTTAVNSDYRSNYGNGSADFDIYIGGYDYNAVSTRQTLMGNNGKSVLWTMFSDTDVTLSRAAALTKLASSFTVNATTKVVTVTANSTYDDLYDALKAWKYNGTQVNVETPTVGDLVVSASGSSLAAYTGWTLVVNSGVTLTAGTKFNFVRFDTVTINGTINGIYGSSAGVSTILELRDVSDGSAYIIANNSTKATILYGNNTSGSTQTYTAYFPPGSAGTQVLVAREKYGISRTSEVITLAEGGMWFTFVDIPDVGISETNQATVAAYTTIENADKFYDRTALFRLTEQGIKLGQIATRDGTSVRVSGYNMVINQSAAAVYGITGSTITLKALGYANGTKFVNTVLDNTKTLTANTNEVLSADFEDANGDSGVTILGGDGTFELWKITTSTATADYATGTKLTSPTIGNEKFRFIGVTGYDIVGVDINSNVRRRTSMAKGVYTQSFYVGEQIQLAQAPQVNEINSKVDLMQVDLEAIKGTGFTKDKHSLTNIKKKAALAAALSA